MCINFYRLVIGLFFNIPRHFSSQSCRAQPFLLPALAISTDKVWPEPLALPRIFICVHFVAPIDGCPSRKFSGPFPVSQNWYFNLLTQKATKIINNVSLNVSCINICWRGRGGCPHSTSDSEPILRLNLTLGPYRYCKNTSSSSH